MLFLFSWVILRFQPLILRVVMQVGCLRGFSVTSKRCPRWWTVTMWCRQDDGKIMCLFFWDLTRWTEGWPKAMLDTRNSDAGCGAFCFAAHSWSQGAAKGGGQRIVSEIHWNNLRIDSVGRVGPCWTHHFFHTKHLRTCWRQSRWNKARLVESTFDFVVLQWWFFGFVIRLKDWSRAQMWFKTHQSLLYVCW